MTQSPKMDLSFRLVLVGLAAWAVPGGGHLLIGQKKHALILFCTITLTFLLGLFIGSIAVIDPVGARPWYWAQMLTSPAVGILGHIVQQGRLLSREIHSVYGRPLDTGQIYTALAGLLNLLAIISAVYGAYSGIGEKIGTEEDEDAQ